jgi:chemotaxis regulatin CheY-phosphate phosphatase CheZ
MSDDDKYERARQVLNTLEWGFERSVIFAALDAGKKAEDELEEYRLRLAGVLTVLEGANRPRPDAKGLLEYVANCPTFRAAWRLRDEVDAAEKRAESAERERDRWKYWTRVLIHAYDNDIRPNTLQLAEMRAALKWDKLHPPREG